MDGTLFWNHLQSRYTAGVVVVSTGEGLGPWVLGITGAFAGFTPSTHPLTFASGVPITPYSFALIHTERKREMITLFQRQLWWSHHKVLRRLRDRSYRIFASHQRHLQGPEARKFNFGCPRLCQAGKRLLVFLMCRKRFHDWFTSHTVIVKGEL